MRIVLVGGGTGGHFYPLIAVAETLNLSPEKPDLYYIGPDKYDAKALEKENIKFVHCPAGKTRRYASVANFFDFFKNIFGIFVALFKLFAIYPDVVFSKGGFTSVPVILAAKLLFIPVVIHESDAVPGRANKIGAKVARYIGIAHDDVAKFFPDSKTALVGIPIRKATAQGFAQSDARQLLNIPNDKPLIYITGGSSGSERLNNQVIDALPELLSSYRVFHQVGEKNIEFIKERIAAKKISPEQLSNYYLQGNLEAETVALVLSASDLVISRSGSTTLFEIALHEKPAILIPIPESISHDQRSNAYSYARNGGAEVIEEENLSDAVLIQEINSIVNDPNRYQTMVAGTKGMQYPEASQKIADILLSIGKEHGS